jgi:hypothetical protein
MILIECGYCKKQFKVFIGCMVCYCPYHDVIVDNNVEQTD